MGVHQLPSLARHYRLRMQCGILLVLFILCHLLPLCTADAKTSLGGFSAEAEPMQEVAESALAESDKSVELPRAPSKQPRKALTYSVYVASLLSLLALGLAFGAAAKRRLEAPVIGKAMEARKEGDAVVARLTELKSLGPAAARLAEEIGTEDALDVLAELNKRLEVGDQLFQDVESRRAVVSARDLLQLEVQFTRDIRDCVKACEELFENLPVLAAKRREEEINRVKDLDYWFRSSRGLLARIASEDYAKAFALVIESTFRRLPNTLYAEAAERDLGIAGKSIEDELASATGRLASVKKAVGEVQPVLELARRATECMTIATIGKARSDHLQVQRSLGAVQIYCAQAMKLKGILPPAVKEELSEIVSELREVNRLLEKVSQCTVVMTRTRDVAELLGAHEEASTNAGDAFSKRKTCIDRLFAIPELKGKFDPDTEEMRETLRTTVKAAAERIQGDCDAVREIATQMAQGFPKGFAAIVAELGGETPPKDKPFVINEMIGLNLVGWVKQIAEKIGRIAAAGKNVLRDLDEPNSVKRLPKLAAAFLAEAVKAGNSRSHALGFKMQFFLLAYLNMDINMVTERFELLRNAEFQQGTSNSERLEQLVHMFKNALKALKKTGSLQETAGRAASMWGLLRELQDLASYSAHAAPATLPEQRSAGGESGDQPSRPVAPDQLQENDEPGGGSADSNASADHPSEQSGASDDDEPSEGGPPEDQPEESDAPGYRRPEPDAPGGQRPDPYFSAGQPPQPSPGVHPSEDDVSDRPSEPGERGDSSDVRGEPGEPSEAGASGSPPSEPGGPGGEPPEPSTSEADPGAQEGQAPGPGETDVEVSEVDASED